MACLLVCIPHVFFGLKVVGSDALRYCCRTVGPNWPNQGEVDIIEGVNLNTVNQMTLHTSSS